MIMILIREREGGERGREGGRREGERQERRESQLTNSSEAGQSTNGAVQQ